MTTLNSTIKVSILVGLRSAWISWDYDDFLKNFFYNRFPNHEGIDPMHDSYALEKWDKFKSNPVSYMCNMDDGTLAEFATAVYAQYQKLKKDK